MTPLNKDQVKGAANVAAGDIEENVGQLAGDYELEDAGRDRKDRGDIREGFGNIKNKVENAFKETTDGIVDAHERGVEEDERAFG